MQPNPGTFHLLILLSMAVVMLFELRTLLQSSGADYYHRVSQAVVRLTNPLVSLPFLRQLRWGPIAPAGLIVAFAIALVACALIFCAWLGIPLPYAPLLALVMTLKCLGYLIVGLLLVQALASWLPATQPLSAFIGQVTHPLVAPIQRIIPPIGMIDLSLMVLLLLLFIANRVCYAIPYLGSFWAIF
ncbi:MAG: YggT family protein [Succinivibrionaceae bacterium]|nr:YggT family protein [Succinivibrionaceae bacterium]